MTSRLALLCCLAAIGCTSPNARICVAGQVLACACAGGGVGVQTCSAGGESLGACSACPTAAGDGGVEDALKAAPADLTPAGDTDLGSKPAPDLLSAADMTPIVYQHRSCAVQMTGPAAITGQELDGASSPPGMMCLESEANGPFELQFSAIGTVRYNYVGLDLTIVRATTSVGSPIDLTSADATLVQRDPAGKNVCPMGWTGTVTLLADEPTWSVQVNASCASAGIGVVATFNGKNWNN